MSDSKPPSDSTPTPNLPRGLIGRRGAPAGKGARLPSIRTPRDLTLGGVQKKTFTPNLPVRREKKEEIKPETSSERKPRGNRGNDRGHRERGRGRGRGKPETIQSHSIFEEGPTQQTKSRVSGLDVGYSGGGGGGRGGGRGGGSGGSSGGRAAISTSGVKHEHGDVMDTLLRDDFIDFGNGGDGDMMPVKLPLSVLCDDIKKEKVAVKEEKKPVIKDEPMDSVDLIENEHTRINPAPMVQAMKTEAMTPEELFTNQGKTERGELLFVQLPDCLPGVPASYGKEEEKNEKGKSRIDSAEKDSFSLSKFSEGYIGKLQIHKSGKTKLVLGNISLDVSVGTPCSFLQDLVSVNIKDEEKDGDMTVLGHVRHRVICTPDFETLLHLSSDPAR